MSHEKQIHEFFLYYSNKFYQLNKLTSNYCNKFYQLNQLTPKTKARVSNYYYKEARVKM